MQLPNADKAYIPNQKLTHYLLSDTHPIGKAKAKFFRSVGFSVKNAYELREQLLRIVRMNPVQEVIATPHGLKYVVDGELHGPSGKVVYIRTVWIIEKNNFEPRFITAYPAE